MPRSSFQLLLLHTIIDPLYYIGPILGRFRDNVFQVNGTGGVISIWDIKGHQKSSESLFLWVVSELCFWLTLCRDKKHRWVCEVVYYPMASNSLIYWRAGEHNILEGESSTNWSAPAQLAGGTVWRPSLGLADPEHRVEDWNFNVFMFLFGEPATHGNLPNRNGYTGNG